MGINELFAETIKLKDGFFQFGSLIIKEEMNQSPSLKFYIKFFVTSTNLEETLALSPKSKETKNNDKKQVKLTKIHPTLSSH